TLELLWTPPRPFAIPPTPQTAQSGEGKAMAESVQTSRGTLALICLTSAGWSFSFGLGAPLASLWLDAAGCRKNLIGWNTGAYYCGMALAALAVPWLMRRYGKACTVLGMLLSGLTVAAFPWGPGGLEWAAFPW